MAMNIEGHGIPKEEEDFSELENITDGDGGGGAGTGTGGRGQEINVRETTPWEKYVDDLMRDSRCENIYAVLDALASKPVKLEAYGTASNLLKCHMEMLQKYMEENGFMQMQMSTVYPPPKILETVLETSGSDDCGVASESQRNDSIDISGIHPDSSSERKRTIDNGSSTRATQKLSRSDFTGVLMKKDGTTTCSWQAAGGPKICSWQIDDDYTSLKTVPVVVPKDNNPRTSSWRDAPRGGDKPTGSPLTSIEKYRNNSSVGIVKNGRVIWEWHKYDDFLSNNATTNPPKTNDTASATNNRSKTSAVRTTDNGAYQILHSYYMSFFLTAAAVHLKRSLDSKSVIRLRKLLTVKKALKFYILTAIRPYTDEGVKERCSGAIPELWRPMRGDNIRMELLHRALDVFNLIMDYCDSISKNFLASFMTDYVCLNEQLIKLRGVHEQTEKYFRFLTTANKHLMLKLLLRLMSDDKPKPKWFMLALGTRIASFLHQDRGLYNYVMREITEGGLWLGESRILKAVAKIFMKIPSSSDKESHCSFLVKEFFQFIECHQNAGRVAACFVYVLDGLPEEWSNQVMAELLHPWEVLLLDSRLKGQLDGKSLYTAELDRSLKILLPYMNGFRSGMHIPYISKFKELFALWIFLYASTLEFHENVPSDQTNALDYKIVAARFETLLHRVYYMMSFETVDQEAEFIVWQIENVYDDCLVELRYKEPEESSIDESSKVDTVQDAANSQDDTVRKPVVRFHFQNIEIVLVKPNEPKDVFIRFTKGMLEFMSKRRVNSFLHIKTAIRCMKRLAELNSIDRFNDAMETDDEDAKNAKQKRLNWFLTDLLPESTISMVISDSNLTNVIGIPVTFLDVTIARLNIHVRKMKMFDIRGNESMLDHQLEKAIQGKVSQAISILKCIAVNRRVEMVELKRHLRRIANALHAFGKAVNDLDENDRKFYEHSAEDARKFLQFLMENGIELNEIDNDTSPSAEPSNADIKSKKVAKFGDDMETSSLQIIKANLSDESERIRGQALINLTKGIQKKDKKFMDEVGDCSWIIHEMIKLVADADTYVCLTAINALVELAYWKQEYFDEMVEFFENPKEKLKAIIDSEMVGLENGETDTYLLIQRIKLVEAIVKGDRKLDEMTPTNFERLVKTMLSLLVHTENDQQRISVLSSLSDLIIACRGLNVIRKYLDEMLLLSKRYLSDTEAVAVRRAALNIVHSVAQIYIIKPEDEMPLSLLDMYELMVIIVHNDQDSIIKGRASLCLREILARFSDGLMKS